MRLASKEYYGVKTYGVLEGGCSLNGRVSDRYSWGESIGISMTKHSCVSAVAKNQESARALTTKYPRLGSAHAHVERMQSYSL